MPAYNINLTSTSTDTTISAVFDSMNPSTTTYTVHYIAYDAVGGAPVGVFQTQSFSKVSGAQQSFVLTGLTPETYYEFYISQDGAADISINYNQVTTAAAPYAGMNVSIVDREKFGMTLYFDDVISADDYRVIINGKDINAKLIIGGSGSSILASIQMLTPSNAESTFGTSSGATDSAVIQVVPMKLGSILYNGVNNYYSPLIASFNEADMVDAANTYGSWQSLNFSGALNAAGDEVTLTWDDYETTYPSDHWPAPYLDAGNTRYSYNIMVNGVETVLDVATAGTHTLTGLAVGTTYDIKLAVRTMITSGPDSGSVLPVGGLISIGATAPTDFGWYETTIITTPSAPLADPPGEFVFITSIEIPSGSSGLCTVKYKVGMMGTGLFSTEQTKQVDKAVLISQFGLDPTLDYTTPITFNPVEYGL